MYDKYGNDFNKRGDEGQNSFFDMGGSGHYTFTCVDILKKNSRDPEKYLKNFSLLLFLKRYTVCILEEVEDESIKDFHIFILLAVRFKMILAVYSTMDNILYSVYCRILFSVPLM